MQATSSLSLGFWKIQRIFTTVQKFGSFRILLSWISLWGDEVSIRNHSQVKCSENPVCSGIYQGLHSRVWTARLMTKKQPKFRYFTKEFALCRYLAESKRSALTCYRATTFFTSTQKNTFRRLTNSTMKRRLQSAHDHSFLNTARPTTETIENSVKN